MGNAASNFFTNGHGWGYFGKMMGNLGILMLSSLKSGFSIGAGAAALMTGNPLGAASIIGNISSLSLQMKSFIESDGQDLNSDLQKVASGLGDGVVDVINAVGKIATSSVGDSIGAAEFGVPLSSPQLPKKTVNVAPAMAHNMYVTTAMQMKANRSLTPMDASRLAGTQKLFSQVASASAQKVVSDMTPLINSSFLLSPPAANR